MKIQYASDLHLEFKENERFLKENPLLPEGDILILAGDVTYIGDHFFANPFFDRIADSFETTYVVPGNHEYYSGVDMDDYLKEIKIPIRSNVFLTNNSSIQYKSVNIIFSTLWSHIRPENARQVERGVSDFYKIKRKGSYLTSDDFNGIHRECLGFIGTAIRNDFQNIVVTHHVPTQRCNTQAFRTSPINNAFVVELEQFIEESGASYWIYGHHHRNTGEVTIGKTKLVTNQLGYVHLLELRALTGEGCWKTSSKL